MPGGLYLPSAGDVLTAANAIDYWSKQAVIACTSGTRPSSPNDGMTIYETDTDRVLVYNGSTWIRVGWNGTGGRTGGTWTRASNQSINNASLTTITFTAETSDSDGYLAPTSGTITIPSGLGGIYAYDSRWTWASSPGTSGWAILINGTVRKYNQAVANTTQGCDGTVALAAADTFGIQVIQNSGGALNLNPASIDFYRLGI